MSTRNSGKTGVILMTYGSATTAEQVPEYLGRIYGGAAPAALVHSFEDRYRLIGHSPLIEITNAQAAALAKRLGARYVVRAGMRHSAPYIEHAVAECRALGATSLVGVMLSPQLASFISRGYCTALEAAARLHRFATEATTIADPWPAEPHFIALLADRVAHALAELRRKYTEPVPVIFTTHSMPERVVADDPVYFVQLQMTVDAVRGALDPELLWYAAYQSAGHAGTDWLKPDLADVLAQLYRQHTPAVLIVPIQFVSDHLEILYDLDRAAKAQCEEYAIAYHRIALPNVDALFIESLAAVVDGARMS